MELKKYKLGDICSFNKNTISQDEDINIEYLETSNLIENKILSIQNVKLSKAPSRAQRKVKHNTILYSTVRPNLKHYGIMKMPSPTMIVSTGFTTIDVLEEYNESVDPFYLYLLITQEHITNYLHTIAENATSAYPSISSIDLENLYFDFPSLKEQKKISLLFSSIDQKIALNRVINHNLEAMAKQLYDYWFVQFDFPNEEGKPYKSSGGKMVWNEKLKREIPEGWKEGQLSDIANITMGQSPEGFSYNTDGDGVLFYQGSTDFGIRFPSVRQYTTSPARFAKKGDVLMSVRAPVGTTNIANNDCCIGRGLAAINSKIGSLTHLYYIINDLKSAFDQRDKTGTTFGSITKNDLYSLPIVKPTNDIVELFERVCSPIFNKQMLIGEEISTLTKQRDKLLPLLMNGQVSVNYDLSHD